jgi:hypothetical protein
MGGRSSLSGGRRESDSSKHPQNPPKHSLPDVRGLPLDLTGGATALEAELAGHPAYRFFRPGPVPGKTFLARPPTSEWKPACVALRHVRPA